MVWVAAEAVNRIEGRDAVVRKEGKAKHQKVQPLLDARSIVALGKVEVAAKDWVSLESVETVVFGFWKP
jgi:hypothetical protein